jgi:hypothetical protein
MFGRFKFFVDCEASLAKVFLAVSAVTMGRESGSFLVTRLAVHLKIFI